MRVRSWIRLSVAALLLALFSTLTIAQSSSTEIRAIWSVETFVLINNSDDGVDVSGLSFVSRDGEITPDDWVLQLNTDTNEFYTLSDLRPGACLVAFFADFTGEIPETVSCSRVIGEFIITSFDDIVWGIPQGGFTAQINGTVIADCSINRTACEVDVPVSGMDSGAGSSDDAPEGDSDPDSNEDTDVPADVDIRAIWNDETLVLINVAEFGVNLSALSLQSAAGIIGPVDWILFEDEEFGGFYALDDVRPGSCLLAYPAETEPTIPETVECTRTIGEFTPITVQDIVWDVTQGGFTPIVDAVPDEACDITTSSCDITVPVAESEISEAGIELDGSTDPALVGGVEVRAIWTPDLMVLINVSRQGSNVSELTLTSTNGAVTPAGWVMNENPLTAGFYTLGDMRPGSCLLVYEEGPQPEIPETVECSRVIGVSELSDIRDVVWDIAQGGFEGTIDGALSAVCSVEGTTSCSLIVPPSE